MISFFLLIICIDCLWIVTASKNNINTDYSVSAPITMWNHWTSKKHKLEINLYNKNTLFNKLKMHKKIQTCKNICNADTEVDKWTTITNSRGTMLKTDCVPKTLLPKFINDNSLFKINGYLTFHISKLPVVVTEKHNIIIKKNTKSTYSSKLPIITRIFNNIGLKKHTLINKQYHTDLMYWPVTKPLITSTLAHYENNFANLYGSSKKAFMEKYISTKHLNQIKTDRYWHVTSKI